MDLEYLLFSQEDPIERMKAQAAPLNKYRKAKVGPLIRRAEAMVRRCQPFRNILMSEDQMSDIISTSFVMFFDAKITRKNFVAVPRDPSFEFVKYISGLMENGIRLDDKYLRKANTIILNNSDAIDAFVKAFISIRLAKSELDKLSS